MSKTNSAETAYLSLLFNNADWANIGDVSGLQGAATAGYLYVSLHEADPGETGNQETSETDYGSYARMGVVRNSGGWTIDANRAYNTSGVTWPTATSGSGILTHFGVGTVVSGTGDLLYSCALHSGLVMSIGITPLAISGAIQIFED